MEKFDILIRTRVKGLRRSFFIIEFFSFASKCQNFSNQCLLIVMELNIFYEKNDNSDFNVVATSIQSLGQSIKGVAHDRGVNPFYLMSCLCHIHIKVIIPHHVYV